MRTRKRHNLIYFANVFSSTFRFIAGLNLGSLNYLILQTFIALPTLLRFVKLLYGTCFINTKDCSHILHQQIFIVNKIKPEGST